MTVRSFRCFWVVSFLGSLGSANIVLLYSPLWINDSNHSKKYIFVLPWRAQERETSYAIAATTGSIYMPLGISTCWKWQTLLQESEDSKLNKNKAKGKAKGGERERERVKKNKRMMHPSEKWNEVKWMEWWVNGGRRVGRRYLDMNPSCGAPWPPNTHPGIDTCQFPYPLQTTVASNPALASSLPAMQFFPLIFIVGFNNSSV